MNGWALITGASEGIGRELAKIFAAHQFNVALVARNQTRLEELAAQLQSDHKIETLVSARDLSQHNAAAGIFAAVRHLPLDVLVNNAGFGSYGDFAKLSLERQTEMIQVNVLALVELTHLFL